jgi:hypothetical protein
MQIEGERLTSNNTAVNTPVLSFLAVYQGSSGDPRESSYLCSETGMARLVWLSNAGK